MSGSSQARSSVSVVAVLCGLAMVLLLYETWVPQPQLDDSFISYRYARNWGVLPAAMNFSTFVEKVWGGAGSSAIVNERLMLRDSIEHGKYIRYIEDWVARIGRERLFVYLFDDMLADPQKLMCRLAHDLRIDPAFYRDYNFVRQNETYRVRSTIIHRVLRRRRNRKIFLSGTVKEFLKSIYMRFNTMPGGEQLSERDQAALATLRDDYAPFNAELAAFLGRRDLPW